MRFTEYLTEANGEYGIIVTKLKSGKFEDIELYDIANNNIAGQGHARNLFDGLVETIREHNAWKDIESFLQQNSSSSKQLGPDYADTENADHILYGPFEMNQIGQLYDKLSATFQGE